MIYVRELVYDVDGAVYAATQEAELPASVDATNLMSYCEATYGVALDLAYTDGPDGGGQQIGWSFDLPPHRAEAFGLVRGELVVVPMVHTDDGPMPLLAQIDGLRSLFDDARRDGLVDRAVAVPGDRPWRPEDHEGDEDRARGVHGGATEPADSEPVTGLEALLDERLPLNRKERYFTGTVFPMIVASDGLAHLDRLLDLLQLRERPISGDPASTDVQFFTEYGYAESRIGPAAGRLPTPPAGRDTPDILIYFETSPRLLVALEAKMYDRPSRARMEKQLEAQKGLLDSIRGDLEALTGEPVELCHAALLPTPLADQLGQLSVRVITWEQLLDIYDDVATPYWAEMLSEALFRYPELASTTASGLNSDAKLTGAEIVERARAQALVYACMGRLGGLMGRRLHEDIETGLWKQVCYEVSFSDTPPNDNWFSIEAFLALLAERHPDSEPRPRT